MVVEKFWHQAFLQAGIVRLEFDLATEFAAGHAQFSQLSQRTRVTSRRPSGAHVRTAPKAQVMTLDADFLIYCTTRRKPARVLTPLAF